MAFAPPDFEDLCQLDGSSEYLCSAGRHLYKVYWGREGPAALSLGKYRAEIAIQASHGRHTIKGSQVGPAPHVG